ncbi:MAG: hypothetical protein IJ693_04215 [Bacteroidaceae bacterium]|nr:hypothetical protein [Bacteroidaceae bacterium]
MKKTFMSFAVAGLMALAMAACGNKGGNAENAGGDEPVAEEIQGEQVDRTAYTVVVPEGWEQEEKEFGGKPQFILTKKIDGKTARLTFTTNASTKKGAEELMKDQCMDSHGWEYSEQTLGANTWNVAYQSNEGTSYAPVTCIFTNLTEGVLDVRLEKSGLENEEVKQIVSSVKVK